MTDSTPPQLSPLGDRAITITLGTTIDERTHKRVRATSQALGANAIAGIMESVPAFASRHRPL